MPFTGQVVFITGASRGIGAAIAAHFAAQGATVIGTATTEQGADNISALFQQNNTLGCGICLNVTDAVARQTVFDRIVSDYGHPSILINNAGITRDNLFLRMKDEEWDEVINTNLNALYHLTKLVIKPMLKARYGRIINIASIVGVMGNPGQVNYVAAKAGMIGFTKALALEIASRNITVNAIAPGFIETDMTNHLTEAQAHNIIAKIPSNRLGTPADIAHTALFLASKESSYITGQTLHVNGGMYLS